MRFTDYLVKEMKLDDLVKEPEQEELPTPQDKQPEEKDPDNQ